MACLSGALMKKKGRWEPLILLEPSCALRFACLSTLLCKYISDAFLHMTVKSGVSDFL